MQLYRRLVADDAHRGKYDQVAHRDDHHYPAEDLSNHPDLLSNRGTLPNELIQILQRRLQASHRAQISRPVPVDRRFSLPFGCSRAGRLQPRLLFKALLAKSFAIGLSPKPPLQAVQAPSGHSGE